MVSPATATAFKRNDLMNLSDGNDRIKTRMPSGNLLILILITVLDIFVFNKSGKVLGNSACTLQNQESISKQFQHYFPLYKNVHENPSICYSTRLCMTIGRLLSDTGCIDDGDDDCLAGDDRADGGVCTPSSSETAELCDLIKSRFECPDFLEKLGNTQASVAQNFTELMSENDLWEGGNSVLDQEDYVLVRQEDIVDGIACFMAAYLLSLEETKELTPNQLQQALCKTFSVKKRKGKLRKAWDGSKVIYSVASWGATAIGIYQNPAILKAASASFWTSCHVISKLF